jgi:hypothetical protein
MVTEQASSGMSSSPMTDTSSGGMGSASYPVDNATYNLLQSATSALESMEAYSKYAKDGDRELFEQLSRDSKRHAEQLLDALRSRLGDGMGAGRMGGSR